MRLTLLTRSYCHLCEDMRQALLKGFPALAAGLIELDVDENAELEARYGERVPVLLADEIEVCHYHFDAAALAAVLAQESPAGAKKPSASGKIAD